MLASPAPISYNAAVADKDLAGDRNMNGRQKTEVVRSRSEECVDTVSAFSHSAFRIPHSAFRIPL